MKIDTSDCSSIRGSFQSIISSCRSFQVQIKSWKSYQKASLRPHTCHFYQLSRVVPSYAIALAACILILPILEHVQLAATDHMNPIGQCGHMTFSLVLSSLDNVLPAMVLQGRLVGLKIGYAPCSSSHFSVRHASPSLDVRVYSRTVVIVLLLLLSGDIEVNPGPLGKCLG